MMLYPIESSKIVSKLSGVSKKFQRMHKGDIKLIAIQGLLSQISLYFVSSQLAIA